MVVRESGLAPFSPLTHEGVWRQLTVRTSLTNALLIIAMVTQARYCMNMLL